MKSPIYNATGLASMARTLAQAGDIDNARRVAFEAAEAYQREADATIQRGRDLVDEINEILESKRIDDGIPQLQQFGDNQ